MRLDPKLYGFQPHFLFAGPNFADTRRTHQEYGERISTYGSDGEPPLA
jgi:hypothetical protein